MMESGTGAEGRSVDELAHLGLSVNLLHTALHRGHFAAANCTRHHPTTAAALYMWAETSKELRDVLIPEGWTTSDDLNIPRTVAPHGEHCVVVVSGNESTGNPHRTPGTRSPRGAAGVRDVQDNQQLWLSEEWARLTGPRPHPPMATWYLLHYTSDVAIRSELSLPVLTTEGGQVEGWHKRIILPEIRLDQLVELDDRAEDGDDGLDIAVSPRGM